ncbi:hypothetical protein [Candidatus Palauibacter sp.]
MSGRSPCFSLAPGFHPGLERMSEFLGRFGIPIEVVSFEVSNWTAAYGC